MRVIEPNLGHRCDLGGPAAVPLGTLAQCEVCSQWWFNRWSPSGDITGYPYEEWSQVRWYHFKMRGRIKNAR